jgi:hypothetical protein
VTSEQRPQPVARKEVHSTVLADSWDGEAAIDATIFQGLSPENIEDVELHWRREFRERTKRARKLHLPYRDPDRHWNWKGKHEERRNDVQQPCYVLEVLGSTEGLIFLQLGEEHVCRLNSNAGASLVYVDLLATAPWNRSHPAGRPKRFRGIGSALLAQAVQRSRIAGWAGRIGLHALAGSEAFYRNVGLTALARDAHKENMLYFEATPESAVQVLTRAGIEV